jgi:hypothetical protein
MTWNCTFERTAALAFIEKMLAALADKPMTRSEMESALFASKTKMLNYIRLLHGDTGEEKRIYIASYDERVTGGRNPRYAAGNKKDAKPLGSKTEAERHRIRKADPDRHRRHLAKLRAAAAAKRSRTNPVTWCTALIPPTRSPRSQA